MVCQKFVVQNAFFQLTPGVVVMVNHLKKNKGGLCCYKKKRRGNGVHLCPMLSIVLLSKKCGVVFTTYCFRVRGFVLVVGGVCRCFLLCFVLFIFAILVGGSWLEIQKASRDSAPWCRDQEGLNRAVPISILRFKKNEFGVQIATMCYLHTAPHQLST